VVRGGRGRISSILPVIAALQEKESSHRLLAHCLDRAGADGMQWAYLEVRRSNDQALSLYSKFGLNRWGCARGSLQPTRAEDAIVMALEMKPSPSLS